MLEIELLISSHVLVVKNLGKIQFEPAMEDLVDLVLDADEGLVRVLGGTFANYGKPGIDMLVQRYEDQGESSNRKAFKYTRRCEHLYRYQEYI